jgi:hypothetical protein
MPPRACLWKKKSAWVKLTQRDDLHGATLATNAIFCVREKIKINSQYAQKHRFHRAFR